MGKSGLIFLLVFGLVWTGMVGAFDAMFFRALYKQRAAAGYPVAAGLITASDLATSRGSRGGTRYSAKIRYSYSVNGRSFVGDRYDYGTFTSSSHQAAADALNEFPVGRKVEVRYNPADPADATLRTGLTGQGLFPFIFLMPFNAIMVGIWIGVVSGVWRWITKPVAGGLKVTENDGLVLVRVAWWAPVTTGLTVVGLAGFISVFVVGIGMRANPTLGQAEMVLGTVAGLGVLAFAATYVFGVRGDRYIAIDERAGTVTLPRQRGGKGERTFPMASVRDLATRTVRQGKSSTTYLGFILTGEENGTAEITVTFNAGCLPGLMEFLRERLGLNVTP